MARPVQLRYDDEDDGETVIGTYLTDDGLIKQAKLKNSGSGEYTRMEIIGDTQLKDRLPIDYDQYATDEPEILVYALDDDGDWTLRDRVFPEEQGIIKDNGQYRNPELWGFQKWVGRKRVTNIDESNSTITEIMNAILPSGYTAETPDDDTVPTVDNYTFNGRIDRAIRDLVRDYPVKIWFTAETNEDDDYIVKVQSKGYGDTVQTVEFTDERQDTGYQILEFEEEDKSDIVNKVEIEGVDSDGDTVQVVEEDQDSIDKHGERYIHRNVGYIESESQAESLAEDILSPDASPHAKVSIPFQDSNILNASISIVDDRFGIDGVYTVVKQRDFFTDSKTEVELGFEKDLSEDRRNRDRELDERNHQLFPTSTSDVGGQDLDAENSSAEADTSTSESERDPDVSGATGTAFGESDYTFEQVVTDTSSQTYIEGTAPSFTTLDTEFFMVHYHISFLQIDSPPQTLDIRITNEDTDETYFDTDVTIGFGGNNQDSLSFTIIEREAIDGDTIRAGIENEDDSLDMAMTLTIDSIRDHDHTAESMNSDSHDHSVSVVDGGHGGAGDPDEHVITGSTAEKILEIIQEQKTDR